MTKYDGSRDSYTHLKIYISELGQSATDEKLRVHLFSKSLTGAALQGLEKAKVNT